MIRWGEAKPEAVESALAAGSPVLWPLGALEWHGDHLPLGLDSLVAEWFAEALAVEAGGLLLPLFCLPITTLPHRLSLQGSTATVVRAWEETLDGLFAAGASRVALVTGHYAQGHLMELIRLARRRLDQGQWVLPATPLELLNHPELLDHAGRSEASQLLAIRPDLVDLDRVGEGKAVLGPSPSGATAEEGQGLLRRGLEAWKEALAWSPDQLRASLDSREASLKSYEEAWRKTTWEEAILSWWQARQGQA